MVNHLTLVCFLLLVQASYLAAVDDGLVEFPLEAGAEGQILKVGLGGNISWENDTVSAGFSSGNSVTDLTDVASAGSGNIITQQERQKLEALTVSSNGILQTDSDVNVGGNLTVTGKMILSTMLITNNGTINNADIGDSIFVRITNSATVRGLQGGENGRMVYLNNGTGSDMKIQHEQPSSSATNRINTPDGSEITLKANGSISLVYTTDINRWVVVSSAQ